MSVIESEIGAQSFELIRNRIGEILADELDMQNQLTYDDLFNCRVYIERFTPFNLSELPAVNVSLARTALDGHDVLNSDGTSTFYIDVHTVAKTRAGEDGDSRATYLMHQLLGVCRAILMDSRYKTLGFAPPFIMHRRDVELKFGNPEKKDAASVCQGRIIFQVKAPENSGVATPSVMSGFQTTVKLYETNQGYYYFGGTEAEAQDGFNYYLDLII